MDSTLRQHSTAIGSVAVLHLVTNIVLGSGPMSRPSLEELMLRFRDGDTRAFELLYAHYRGPLFRFIKRQSNLPDMECEEIFQEAWIRVINSCHQWQPRTSLDAWIFTIARNLVIDSWRRNSRNPVQVEGDFEQRLDQEGVRNNQTPEVELAHHQGHEHVLRLLNDLPVEQREVFLLKEEGGFSLKEIAEITGENIETVKSRLRYALKKLRDALSGTLEA